MPRQTRDECLTCATPPGCSENFPRSNPQQLTVNCMNTEIKPKKATILVVDDILDNITVLLHFLSKVGYSVLVAQDGEEGLETAEYALPDLILLDVMMPGIDGFETCRQLKDRPNTRDIPVIFMTALHDTKEKLRGFEVGAADYITKPFQHEEVLARIDTHLRLHHLQQQLHQRNQELQTQAEELRQRNMELDAFAHTVAHDLKNPLNVILGFAELIGNTYAKDLDSDAQRYFDTIVKCGHKMFSIIESLLLLASVSKQEVSYHPLDMAGITQQATQRLEQQIQARQAEIIIQQAWPQAYGYAPWVEEIWVNYLSNALKYGGNPPRIQLWGEIQENMVRLWVEDNGPGLNEEARLKMFTPFTRLHRHKGEGHGLGLSIVQRIAEKMGGAVGVESTEGEGSRFFFTLPASHAGE